MVPAVQAESVVKRYGEREVLRGISLEIAQGELFALLGPNGAGKTTFVEILEGYRHPDSGRVRVLGLDPVSQAAELHRRIGVMLQEGGLYPAARPLELLKLFAGLYADSEPPLQLAETLGLEPVLKTPVRRLSGGQRQRLSLALAIIGKPQVLFLDEPTAGMDVQARRLTWELLRALTQQGRTLLLTTHYLEEAEQLADRVAVLGDGRLLALGTPQELSTHTMRRVRFRVEGVLNASLLTLPVIDSGDGWWQVDLEPGPEVVSRLARDLAAHQLLITDLRAGAGSLEEAFVHLTGSEARI